MHYDLTNASPRAVVVKLLQTGRYVSEFNAAVRRSFLQDQIYRRIRSGG